MDTRQPGEQLEHYSLLHPNEVLIVQARIEDLDDEIVVYRGYSSSLVQPTHADPSVPVLPATASIERIDRLQAPYAPGNPVYLEQGLTWPEFQQRLG